jgi:hypothetical protein
MDLPQGAFGAFLLKPARLCFSSSCPARGFGDNPLSEDLTGTAETVAARKK